MTESLTQALFRAAAAVLVLLPVAVMLAEKRDRILAVVAGSGAMVLGALLWWLPIVDGPTLKTLVLRGNTLFASLFILAALVLGMTGLSAWGSRRRWMHYVGVLLLVVPLFALDGIELADQLRQIAFLKNGSSPYIVGFAVIALVLAAVLPAAALLRKAGAQRYLAPWSLLIFVVSVRAGFEPFLITLIEGLVARVMHDSMHTLIVLILLPDHAFLSGFLWNLIGLTFKKSTATVLNLCVFLGIATYLAVRTYYAGLPVHPGLKAPERRRKWADERTARRKASVPAYVAMILFSVLAVRSATFRGSPTPPDREKLVTRTATGGATVGVITTAVLEDGKLHVWTYESGGKSFRVFAIRKPDQSVVVCLDACLVCAPDGYAEMGEDLFCLYCGTPIPMSTVGQPGGCNPVPLNGVERKGDRFVFDTAAALRQWTEVTQGK